MTSKEIKTITRVDHLGTSVNGNPYFGLTFEDGTEGRTMIDSMINYDVRNSENLNRPVQITRTRAGRVRMIRPV